MLFELVKRKSVKTKHIYGVSKPLECLDCGEELTEDKVVFVCIGDDGMPYCIKCANNIGKIKAKDSAIEEYYNEAYAGRGDWPELDLEDDRLDQYGDTHYLKHIEDDISDIDVIEGLREDEGSIEDLFEN